jgi:hypothetical protein
MNALKKSANSYSTIAWGILLLFLGVLMIIPGDQNGIFLLGTGFVLLGLNVARWMSRAPVNAFSTTLGILGLIGGTYALMRPLLNLPHFEVGFIPLALIIVGLYVLIPGPKHSNVKA